MYPEWWVKTKYEPGQFLTRYHPRYWWGLRVVHHSGDRRLMTRARWRLMVLVPFFLLMLSLFGFLATQGQP